MEQCKEGYWNEKKTCILSASDCQSRLVFYKDTFVGGCINPHFNSLF